MDTTTPHYHGHRSRLRERFVKSGFSGFSEHEVLELLLTLAIPRRDVKQPAKLLMERYGSLKGVLDAPMDELGTVKWMGEVGPVALIRLFAGTSSMPTSRAESFAALRAASTATIRQRPRLPAPRCSSAPHR